MYAVSDLTQKCYPTLQMFFGGDRVKHPKLWDGISSILVLFGLDLYGSCCWYGVWALVYAALGCVVLGTLIAVFTQRCPFCRRYLGMMFFSGKKMYCPHCGSDVHADRNV